MQLFRMFLFDDFCNKTFFGCAFNSPGFCSLTLRSLQPSQQETFQALPPGGQVHVCFWLGFGGDVRAQ